MFFKMGARSSILGLFVLATGCSFFESSFAERERILKRLAISISIEFFERPSSLPACSKKAVFEIEPDGTGHVRWFNDGMIGDHGCSFDMANSFKSEKFKLSNFENISVRKKLAEIDWPLKRGERNNICSMITNEGPPVILKFGDDYSIPFYTIYPNWVDDHRHLSKECQRDVQREVDIIENVISYLPITYSKKLSLK
ncbi:MAG: hypothetical protein ABJP02_14900 [Parasphingorhabdus sp.]|uniref:hypothetical protein n=1 Tax=Parasphingorhabdus sp. TaxID=2709688 RepID=UPI003298A6B1